MSDNQIPEDLLRRLKEDKSDFLDTIIGEACSERASDIHFECGESGCRIRFRIDGQMIVRHDVSRERYASLVNQIKILSSLDIAEKRLPQDGRIHYGKGGGSFDIRVSVIPVARGEKVVMRLLTRREELLDIANLGMDAKQYSDFLRAIGRPHGMVLISGPTGSGKSTTLYAALRRLNRDSRNILTVEDPVEYTLDGINQVQVKEEIGLTFSEALRAFLRQDPDIIMVGEIRDAETAQIAVRSALTGHLVLSTIHTNSATGCISRLEEMGMDRYLLADTVCLMASQRLVRLLCPECRKETTLPDGSKRYTATGCPHCHGTGYFGRRAIYEIVPVSEGMAECIRTGEGSLEARAREEGIRPIEESAAALYEAGLTSYEEIHSLI